jgi:hypothetical protein
MNVECAQPLREGASSSGIDVFPNVEHCSIITYTLASTVGDRSGNDPTSVYWSVRSARITALGSDAPFAETRIAGRTGPRRCYSTPTASCQSRWRPPRRCYLTRFHLMISAGGATGPDGILTVHFEPFPRPGAAGGRPVPGARQDRPPGG